MGGQLEATPLFNVFLNLIFHLNDGSGFSQIRCQYDISDDAELAFGINLPYGSKGTEFGGVEVFEGGYLRPVPEGYLRASYYF